jgi:hypothetical protein
MSEHEALARFHYECAARHHKVEIRRLWRSRCMMHAQRSPLTNVLIRDPALAPSRIDTSAPAVDLPYRQGDLKCRGQVGEVSCAFLY